MRSKSERIKVEVKDSTEGDVRIFIITLTTPVHDFQMTDLLRQRKVIEPLNSELKRAVKDATARYLSAAESMVSALALRPKRMLKSRISESGKRSNDPGRCAKFKDPTCKGIPRRGAAHLKFP